MYFESDHETDDNSTLSRHPPTRPTSLLVDSSTSSSQGNYSDVRQSYYRRLDIGSIVRPKENHLPSITHIPTLPISANVGPSVRRLLSVTSSLSIMSRNGCQVSTVLCSPIVDLETLANFCCSSYVSPSVRGICWLLLLGVLPPHRDAWVAVMGHKEEQYNDMKNAAAVLANFQSRGISNENESVISILQTLELHLSISTSRSFNSDSSLPESLRTNVRSYGQVGSRLPALTPASVAISRFPSVLKSNLNNRNLWTAYACLTVFPHTEADAYWCTYAFVSRHGGAWSLPSTETYHEQPLRDSPSSKNSNLMLEFFRLLYTHHRELWNHLKAVAHAEAVVEKVVSLWMSTSFVSTLSHPLRISDSIVPISSNSTVSTADAESLCTCERCVGNSSLARVWDGVVVKGNEFLLNFALALVSSLSRKLMSMRHASEIETILRSVPNSESHLDSVLDTAGRLCAKYRRASVAQK